MAAFSLADFSQSFGFLNEYLRFKTGKEMRRGEWKKQTVEEKKKIFLWFKSSWIVFKNHWVKQVYQKVIFFALRDSRQAIPPPENERTSIYLFKA